MSKPRKKRKKVLFILEIIVLLLFIGGLYVYGQISAKLDKIDIQGLVHVCRNIYLSVSSCRFSTSSIFSSDNSPLTAKSSLNDSNMCSNFLHVLLLC